MSRVMVSALDGVWLGGVAGLGYAVLVAVAGIFGYGASMAGVLGLAVIAALVAVPCGLLCGGLMGLFFGTVAAARHGVAAWMEPGIVAALGALVLGLVLAGGGSGLGVLAWASGPLVAGTPAAAIHASRLRRRLRL